MEPLIKQNNNNKNNTTFDCTTTAATLLNGNQQTIHQKHHSVSYLSSKWSQERQVSQPTFTKHLDADHHQELRNQLLIL